MLNCFIKDKEKDYSINDLPSIDNKRIRYYKEFKVYLDSMRFNTVEFQSLLVYKDDNIIEAKVLSKNSNYSSNVFDINAIAKLEECYEENSIKTSGSDFKRRIIKNLEFKDVVFKLEELEIQEMETFIFKDCIFRACDFIGIKTSGRIETGSIVFKNCEFTSPKETVIEYPKRYGHEHNYFIDNRILIRFYDCNVEKVIATGSLKYLEFKNCTIIDMNFSTLKIGSVLFNNCVINDSDLIDFSFKTLRFIKSEIYSSHVFPNHCKQGESGITKSIPDLLKMYKKLSLYYYGENDRKLGQIYYLCSKLTANDSRYNEGVLDDGFPFEKFLHYFILPDRIFVQMLIVMFVFSIIYLLIGLRVPGENQVLFSILYLPIESISIRLEPMYLFDFLANFHKSIYFSCLTFTTVGYGDLVIREWFEIIPMIEMFLGVFYFGVFTGSIFKRYV